MTIAKDRLYGVLVDQDDMEDSVASEVGHWGYETFGDGHSAEKRMDDIIITAANHSCDPKGGLKPRGRHFTWMAIPGPAFEEPKRPKA